MEAIALVLEGSKVKRESWYLGKYLYKNLESKDSGCLVNDPILCHEGYSYMLNTADSTANDWEIYQEPVIKEENTKTNDNNELLENIIKDLENLKADYYTSDVLAYMKSQTAEEIISIIKGYIK
jgi:hypothetical protein